MIAVLVIFFLSLAGIAVLFAHKIYEIKKGKVLMFSDAREKADVVVSAALTQHREALVKKSRHVARAFFLHLKKVIHDFSLRAVHWVHAKLTRLLERMKSRSGSRRNKDGSGGGSVSFFLKNVAEYKEEMKNEQGGQNGSMKDSDVAGRGL